ncbi:MAG: DNA/RNA non-specific endonuclease [Cyclobacteriaceae bacterium]
MLKKILLLFIPFFAIGQDFEPKPNQGELVRHSYYTLSYVEQHEQAEWVYYILSEDLAGGTESRTNNFRSDPLVKSISASIKDYQASGYDRGHLAPAGDMTINATAMSESFFMSNMSPQLPNLNRGKWKNLEALFRGWTIDNGDLFVVTGPIFEDNQGKIGENAVTIPGYYYKIAYSIRDNKMIGFVMPNKKLDRSLETYVVSVDYIESKTGIDFYRQLEDNNEAALESRIAPELWNFSIKSIQKNNPISSGISSARQCAGVAKSTGKRCRSNTKNENGYCGHHQSQAK